MKEFFKENPELSIMGIVSVVAILAIVVNSIWGHQ